MKKGLNFITKFKFNSVFIKTFIILVLLCVLMMIIFYRFSTDITKKNFEEKIYSTNLNIVNQISNSADVTFFNLSLLMNNTLYNKNVITGVMAPSQMDYEKNVTLTRQLKDTVDGNPLINYAIFYVVNSNKIYTSTNIISDYDDYSSKNIIETYISNPYDNIYSSSKKILTDIRLIDKKIYLFQEFPYFYNGRKAVLVFELNRYEFFKLLYGDIDKNKQNVYIFDNEYNPLFSLQTNYNGFGDINNYKSKLVGNSGFFPVNKVSGDSDIYFYSKSGKINWTYIYPVTASDMKFSLSITLGVVLPFLIVFAIISMFFSLYITIRIYKPINELMKSVVVPIDSNTAKDEYDLLDVALKNATFKQGQFNNIMQNITPVILERLFSGLLNGKDLSKESVDETLNSINNPFNSDSYYTVVLVSIVELLNKNAAYVESDFCILSITNIVHALLNNNINHYVQRTSDLSLAVILECPKLEASTQIKKDSMDLCTNINTHTRNLPYAVNTGIGGIYNNIMDLMLSYNEAKENLNFKMYFGNDDVTSKNGEIEQAYDKAYIFERTKSIMQNITNGNIEKTKELTRSFIKDISNQITDLELVKVIYKIFIDVFIEKMISMRINDEDISFADKKYLDKDFEILINVNQVSKYTQLFCNQALDLIDVYSRKSYYKHIDRAKEYVANNYFDIGLSLNMVAEYVGINQSYLCRLFKENTNENFVDYISQYRIEKAELLLDSTNLTVKEVGYKVGFNSMPTFFRVFKKYNGLTPGQYRNKNN